ncbi:MAG TPA: hypothetical protein ENI58_03675 [Nitrospirae bacterium]|nr:hypothetical protein [Nitrospirota bacterium]
MKKKLFCLCKSALISALLVFMMSVSIYAEPVESIRVIKISSQDESAIVRTPDGRMQIIKVGDILRVAGSGLQVKGQRKSGLRGTGKESAEFRAQSSEHSVQGYGLRVVEITSGRVVFEERTERGIETVIVRVADGKQRIERIRRAGEERPILYRAK